MVIIFPSNPANPTKPEPSFEPEVEAARAAGFEVAYFDTEIQLGGVAKFRGLPPGGGHMLYRGWLLRPDRYLALDNMAQARGYQLVTNHAQYMLSYELPQWYDFFEALTPHSIWSAIEGFDAMPGGISDLGPIVKRASRVFQDRPVIVKDYVKSRKHEWFDACFIRSAKDEQEALRVVSNFVKLQGEDLYGGLVFREFITCKQIGVHPKSKLPLTNEWRQFFWRGEHMVTTPYWTDGVQSEFEPPPDEWTSLVQHVVKSRGLPFVAVDSVQRESGSWMALEVNDGGAAGIPESSTPEAFYSALNAARAFTS